MVFVHWRQQLDKEIYSEVIRVERKIFSFELRENARGRFLRMTEDVHGRRDTVIIPASGLELLRDKLNEAIDASEKAGPCKEDIPPSEQ